MALSGHKWRVVGASPGPSLAGDEPQMGPRAGERALPHRGRPDTSCLFKALVAGVWGDETRMFWSPGNFIILHFRFRDGSISLPPPGPWRGCHHRTEARAVVGGGDVQEPFPPQLWPEEPRPEEGLRGVSPHGLPLPLSTASYFPKPESRQRSDGGKGVRRLVFPFARSQLVPMGREKGSAQVGAGLPSLSGPDDPAQPGDTGHLPLQHPLFKEGVSARGPGVPTQEVMERRRPLPRKTGSSSGVLSRAPQGQAGGWSPPGPAPTGWQASWEHRAGEVVSGVGCSSWPWGSPGRDARAHWRGAAPGPEQDGLQG